VRTLRRLLSKNKTDCEVFSCIASSFREWATAGGKGQCVRVLVSGSLLLLMFCYHSKEVTELLKRIPQEFWPKETAPLVRGLRLRVFCVALVKHQEDWRRTGRCSQLLSDAKHPQHPRNGFWLGVSWAKSVEFSKVK
jgi:hypothetical protein